MGDIQLHYQRKYKKQLKSSMIVVRVDESELSRIKELEKQTKRSRSDLIRQSLYDLFTTYGIK